MASPHQLWTLSLSFEVTNIILEILKYSKLTSEEQLIMESKQLHTERHPFGQNCHLNINLQLPLKNLKWKLRNGNVTDVLADYAKNFNQILDLLIRNMVSKCMNLLCFIILFVKNLEISVKLLMLRILRGGNKKVTHT